MPKNDNYYLFLGFNLSPEIDIEYGQRSDEVRDIITNFDGRKIISILELFWAMNGKNIEAKFRSSSLLNNNKEGRFYWCVDFLMYDVWKLKNDQIW